MRGDGRVFGIAFTATRRDFPTRAPWLFLDAGDNTFNLHKPKWN
jgi:hypothetical protein